MSSETILRMLSCEEEEFDQLIDIMKMEEVIDTITLLQGEMEKEQTKFDNLSKKLQTIDESVPEHDEISNQLVESQMRLAMLASRNMKCFSQQISNENQDLLTGLEEEKSVSAQSVSNVKEIERENYQQVEKSDSTKPLSPVTVPEINTVFQTDTSHGSADTSPRNNSQNSSPREGAFKMRSSFDRGEGAGDAGEKPRTPPSYSSQTSFTVRSSRPSSQVDTPNSEQPEQPVESINFAAARNMFEGGNKTSVKSQPASRPAQKQNGAGVPAWKKSSPAGDAKSDTLSSSGSSGAKLSTASVVLSSTSQNHGQGGPPSGVSGGYQKVNTRSTAFTGGLASTNNDDKGSKAKVPQAKTWHQRVREMGNQSCTRNPKQEAEPPTPENESAREFPGRGLHTPSPVRDSGTPSTVSVTRSPSQQIKLEYNIAPVAGTARLPTQDNQAVSNSSSLSNNTVSATESVVTRQQQPEQQHQKQEEQTLSIDVTENGYDRDDVSDIRRSDSVRVNGFTSSASGQSVLSKPVNYEVTEEEGFTTEDKVQDRVTLINWDPVKLLKDVYEVKLKPNIAEASKYINMEGYMEKLPQNKTKATLLKTWKRRYFKAKDGVLYYYESKSSVSDEDPSKEEEINFHNAGLDHATGHFQLMGGCIEDLGNKMLGIDDGRGRYLITRCPTDSEFLKWKRSLDTQTVGNIKETYIQPALRSPHHSRKKVVVIDLGSCSIRAGILGEQASLPQLFFPTVVATDRDTGVQHLGFDAFKPEVRSRSTIAYPIRPTANVDKFTVNMDLMAPIFGKVFTDLKIDPKQYLVMISAPASLNDLMKGQFMEVLVNKFGVAGVNIVNQTLLSLYSYSASSGIVVDVGERLEIVPITDGYIVDGGVTRQPYGGHKVADCLNATLAESKYHFFTHVDFTIVRRVMEEVCYVSQTYEKDVKKWEANSASVRQVVNLDKYDIPEGFLRDVSSDIGRFRAPEGLFNLSVWGMDNQPLHKLVQKAVQACPMDTRREMWRSVYLSGGVTMMPGFTERLQTELIKIVPGSIVVQVHSSPQRYHAAYIGACTLAGIPEFEKSCITSQEWKQRGLGSLQKWQLY